MSRNTSSKNKSAKLTHSTKVGYRTTYTTTKKGRSPIWSFLGFIIAVYILTTSMNVNPMTTSISAQAPVTSSLLAVDGIPLTLNLDFSLLLPAISLLYICFFSIHKSLTFASFLTSRHQITMGKLRQESHEELVTYNTNVKFRSLVKGIKCQKRFGFFGHVVNNEQVFYDVPEFPNGF